MITKTMQLDFAFDLLTYNAEHCRGGSINQPIA